MAVAFVAAATTNIGGTSVSPTTPAGVVDGHALIQVITTDSDHAISVAPAGWTQVGTTQTDAATDSSTSVFRKIASGEGGTLTGPTFGTTENGLCAVLAYSGVDGSAPINAFAQSTGTSGTQSSPSITPTVDNCMIVAIYGTDPAAGQAGTPETSPLAATERVDAINGTLGYIYVQEFLQTTAAAVVLQPATITADNYSRFAVALTPATVGGGGGAEDTFARVGGEWVASDRKARVSGEWV